MKYMGSKRTLMKNGLGETVLSAARDSAQFADLFCGSAAVSNFVSRQTSAAVLAVDLQSFATILAGAVICRSAPIDGQRMFEDWSKRWRPLLKSSLVYRSALSLSKLDWRTKPQEIVEYSRAICEMDSEDSIVSSYGGHYFHPLQALIISAMRQTIPESEPFRTVALAGLIIGSMRCVAAPGHTAQPFQPSESGAPHIFDRWSKDVSEYVRVAIEDLAPQHSQTLGRVLVGDALEAVALLNPGDVAFLDPPYSAVHYSRFYHVLETIARGDCSPVSGVGRYPPTSERPISEFSMKGTSESALDLLLGSLAERRVNVILTFPSGEASNGLSGARATELAKQYFQVVTRSEKSIFSTLGGKPINRQGRQATSELILHLRPI